jgi:hypothetical protein
LADGDEVRVFLDAGNQTLVVEAEVHRSVYLAEHAVLGGHVHDVLLKNFSGLGELAGDVVAHRLDGIDLPFHPLDVVLDALLALAVNLDAHRQVVAGRRKGANEHLWVQVMVGEGCLVEVDGQRAAGLQQGQHEPAADLRGLVPVGLVGEDHQALAGEVLEDGVWGAVGDLAVGDDPGFAVRPGDLFPPALAPGFVFSGHAVCGVGRLLVDGGLRCGHEGAPCPIRRAMGARREHGARQCAGSGGRPNEAHAGARRWLRMRQVVGR